MNKAWAKMMIACIALIGSNVQAQPPLTYPSAPPAAPPPTQFIEAPIVPEQMADVVWWESQIVQPLGHRGDVLQVNVDSLMQLALQNSEQIKAVKMTTLMRNEDTNILRADYEDPNFFADTKLDDWSDPVGNTLTTGGPPRLNQDLFSFDTGIRTKSYYGTTFSLSQKLGHDDSNSLFFTPRNQGNARMTMNVRQPLMKGRGKVYNNSFIVETAFQTAQSEAAYLQTLQDLLFDVGVTYWSLYRTRATLLQQLRHVSRANGIAEQLQERQILDSVRSQVLRARAAVATRNSEFALTEAELRNVESRLRALINAPCLLSAPELIPAQLPPVQPYHPDIPDKVSQALCNRPEMTLINAQINAADVRHSQAQHETKPSLDLFAETYVSGLEGNSQIGTAFREQFTQGTPSYTVGVQFSMPLANKAANARVRQTQFDQMRVKHLLQNQTELIRSEVEIASRKVMAAHRTIMARRLSVEAVAAEMNYLTERWLRLRGDPNLGQLQLDDLLNAQVRLYEEEKALVAAQATYGTALLELQRAAGELVFVE